MMQTMKEFTMNRAKLGSAGLAAIVLLTAGCSQAPDTVNAAPAQPAAVQVPVDDLDSFHAADAKFYGPMQGSMRGALLARPPATVKAATAESTVVVAARVSDVSLQRVIGDVQTMGVTLTDVEVVHGKLEPSLNGKVVVELFLGDPGYATKQIESFRTTLPQGYGIWFLRWQGDKKPVTKPGADPADDPADPALYAVVHRHAMFTQGQTGVTNAIAEHDEGGRPMPGLQSDVEKLSKLSQLADQVRAL